MEAFEDLKGKTIVGVISGYDEITLLIDDGTRCRMYHSQDCCESVYVESIDGDWEDIVGSPLLMAEEVSNPEPEPPAPDGADTSQQWTFYKLATERGYLTIRWFGSSNGYYSTSVDVEFSSPKGEANG